MIRCYILTVVGFLRGGYHCGLFTTDTYRYVRSAAPVASETSDLRFLIFVVLLYHVLWAEVELERSHLRGSISYFGPKKALV